MTMKLREARVHAQLAREVAVCCRHKNTRIRGAYVSQLLLILDKLEATLLDAQRESWEEVDRARVEGVQP